ncbi:MAG TPA: enoyl-CoA hydratase-related protein [Candidatus Dormibacteraeota bacterium]|jgi:enoyl-CoA hydratase/carnithine racemase|nr:enoyl-CoA hydratase-related protein [Candidatus Dormibacteraeota bacterium]
MAEDVEAKLENRVGTLLLSRPPVNAMRTQTYRELAASLRTLQADRSCSAIVIRSAVPGIFCAGADVRELPMTREVDEERQLLTRTFFAQVLRSPVPIICAVDGPALGAGCQLAAACDVRLATRGARFGVPEITVGRCGAGRYLMRVLPQGTVRQMYFTGTPISAEQAFNLGMVAELLDDADALHRRAAELAAGIAAKSPTAVRLAKQSLDIAEELSVLAGYEVEQQFSLRLAATPDAAEAVAAFREKRQPHWSE